MIEKYFNISKDEAKIYGFLNKVGSDDLVIFLHGLGDDCHAHHIYNCSKYLNENGIDTYRYNLFSGRENGRRSDKTRLIDLEDDFNAVVRFHRKRYSNVYVIGHSLGGSIAILGNNELVDKLLLWEPSLNPKKRFKQKIEEKETHYLLNWGTMIALDKTFVKELSTLSERIVEDINTSVGFVFAERSKIFREWQPLLDEYHVVENASHRFDERKAEEELIDVSHDMLL